MKDHIKDNIMNFFIIVTLVNLVMFISGSILAPEMRFGYEAFVVPIIDGLLGIIPGIIMYSKRELTVRQMLIREVIQLLAIEAIILFFTFGLSDVSGEDITPYVVAVAVSVAVVYVLVIVIRYLLDSRKAVKMTSDLKVFQEMSAGE